MLTFVHITDTHIHPDVDFVRENEQPPYKAAVKLVEAVNGLPFAPDFVLHTGDVAYDPLPEAYAHCKTIFGALKYPIHYVIGNHDHSETLQKYLAGVENPTAFYHYEFEANGVQVVVVDSNGPERELPGGHVTETQLQWLSDICSADDPRPLVIAVHHNMIKSGVPWLDGYMITCNGDAFHQAILPAKDRLRGVFYGHVHQNHDLYKDGILYCSAASSWVQFQAYPGMTNTIRDSEAKPGFSVVMIDEDTTFVRRYQFTVE